jgi:DNA-binding response OmpR family regulator
MLALYAGAGAGTVSAAGTGLTPAAWQSWTMRVLVVEDFEVLARTLGTGLRREGMAVDVVLDGNDALEHLAVTRYDVVVLDRDVPGVHGDEICRQAGS